MGILAPVVVLVLLEKDGPARVAGGHVGSVETMITASSNGESTCKWARHILHIKSMIAW